jgi:hypothetical protein
VTFQPGQPTWIHRYVRHGGRVWIAIRHAHNGGPRLGPPVDDLYLIHGRYVLDVVERGLRMEQNMIAGRWPEGPKGWDWGMILEKLIG